MLIKVDLDEALLTRASELMGEMDPAALLNEALQALIERESARRLTHLGGSDADLDVVPRR